MPSTRREKEFETRDRRELRHVGGALLKFVSPGLRGVPDRIRLGGLMGIYAAIEVLRDAVTQGDNRFASDEDTVREIVTHIIRLVEYKAPGKRPTATQRRMHDKLRGMGLTVDVINS